MNTTNVGTTVDPTLLHGIWREAQVNEDKQLQLAPPNRGGRSSIEFAPEEISWNGPLNCGFGSRKLGHWKLDGEKLTLTFTREQGYVNRQLDKNIEENMDFYIKMLNVNELVLADGEGAKFYFVN